MTIISILALIGMVVFHLFALKKQVPQKKETTE